MLVILRYNRYNANFDVKLYISVTPVGYVITCMAAAAAEEDVPVLETSNATY